MALRVEFTDIGEGFHVPDVPPRGLSGRPWTGPRGRVALVTGGSRGIGRACALALAGDGFDVAVNYRRDARGRGRRRWQAIEALGRRARCLRGRGGVARRGRAMVDAVLEDFGAVDTLVHSAGHRQPGPHRGRHRPRRARARASPSTPSAPITCAGWCSRRCGARPRGDVVFVSSVAAKLLAPNSAPYNMAKAALEALAMTLAKEERRHGIHVNVVAPGLVVTEMGRRLVRAMGVDDIATMDASAAFGRVCRPEDVAGGGALSVLGGGGLPHRPGDRRGRGRLRRLALPGPQGISISGPGRRP